jgi:hypothetical protein
MAEVFEVATFYHHFEVLPNDATTAALTVRVCDGLSCEMGGAKQLLAKLPSLLGSDVRVITAPCVGRCEQAPVAVVHQNAVPHATPERVLAAVSAGDTQQALPDYVDLDAYVADGGYALVTALAKGATQTEDVLQASQLFQKFAGKTVAGVQPGPLAREIRVVAVGVNAELNSASRALAPLQLPGIEALEQASEQVSTWQDNNDEEVVLAFKSSAEAVKEAWQKAKGIQETLASRSADLQRARKALSAEIWGQLLQEADLPAELHAEQAALDDRLQAPSFYEKLPEIDQLTRKLEEAYGQRRQAAQQTLAAQVQQRVQQLEQTPGFTALEPERQQQLKAPLQQKASDAEALDLVRLRDQPVMLEGLLRQQEQLAQKWAFPEQEVSTVSVRELCREPFDAAGLDDVLNRIRQRCEAELGNDRKVLLQ